MHCGNGFRAGCLETSSLTLRFVVLDHLPMCSIAKLLQETVEHSVLVVDFTAQCEVVSHPELVVCTENLIRR